MPQSWATSEALYSALFSKVVVGIAHHESYVPEDANLDVGDEIPELVVGPVGLVVGPVFVFVVELGTAATALWFNRGMGPKFQRFISAVISP